jgi:hypothetical protein
MNAFPNFQSGTLASLGLEDSEDPKGQMFYVLEDLMRIDIRSRILWKTIYR